MGLRKWAQSAFEKHRPRCVGNDEPNPAKLARLRWWKECLERFGRRWPDLKPDGWLVPQEHACYGGLRLRLSMDPADFVRLCILETALDLAWDKMMLKTPDKVAPAVRELDSLNDKIVIAAAGLATLFRQRDQLLHGHALDDEENDPMEGDPFDLWCALEAATNAPVVQSWASVAADEIEKFLCIARTQSRPGPRWPDLLDRVASRPGRDARPADAGDASVFASRTNTTEWARWGRSFLAELDAWRGAFPKGFLRSCVTHDQVATLLEVALDAPAGAFNAEQVRKLSNRQRKS